MKHLKYLSYVLRHKWYVFVECCKLGIPWRGIVHDLSKFLPDEWFPYANYFYANPFKPKRNETGYYKPYDTGDEDFDLAWLKHQKRNPHHWQYWVLPKDNEGEFVLQEPGQGPWYPIYLSRDNRHVAMFDEDILDPEDRTEVNNCNENAYRFAKEIRDRLNITPKILPMPLKYCKEMLADWRGAGKAQGKPDTKAWYEANRNKMQLHHETRKWVEKALEGGGE